MLHTVLFSQIQSISTIVIIFLNKMMTNITKESSSSEREALICSHFEGGHSKIVNLKNWGDMWKIFESEAKFK